MPDDEVVLVAARTSGRGFVQEGSLVIACRSCGEPCWVSEGTIRDHPSATVECLVCFDLQHAEFVMPAPGSLQMRELEANGVSAEEVRQVLERLRRGEL